MAINKSYKRWLLAALLVILLILFFEWIVNRNRIKEKLKNENIQHGINK